MRVLREPLLHFLVLGALIFGAFALRADRQGAPADRIVVGPGEIEHLASGFARTWQRPPTPAELDGLIDDYVRDEVYYREGVALGLERDDTVVRRRLRQKMEFLVEDATEGPPPSDDVLQTFLAAHPERYRREPELSFRQVFVNPDRRGDRARDDAEALLARLAAAGPAVDTAALGDPIMLPADLDQVGPSEVARVFGDAFADRVAALELSRWSGPVESGYGLHLVFVRSRSEGRLPPLADVRNAVARDVTAAERKRMVEAAYRQLRTRYEVVIERPGEDAVAGR
jgi:hypothetical protein